MFIEITYINKARIMICMQLNYFKLCYKLSLSYLTIIIIVNVFVSDFSV